MHEFGVGLHIKKTNRQPPEAINNNFDDNTKCMDCIKPSRRPMAKAVVKDCACQQLEGDGCAFTGDWRIASLHNPHCNRPSKAAKQFRANKRQKSSTYNSFTPPLYTDLPDALLTATSSYLCMQLSICPPLSAACHPVLYSRLVRIMPLLENPLPPTTHHNAALYACTPDTWP